MLRLMQNLKEQFKYSEQKYIFKEPDFTQTRNDNVLLIWGDIPFWTVLDNEFYTFLQTIHKSSSLKNHISLHAKNEVEIKQLIYGTNLLIKNGILLRVPAINLEKNNSNPNSSQKTKIENITINLTAKCDLRCIFCYNKRMPSKRLLDNEISSKEAIDILYKIRPYTSKYASIIILGGEPLLFKEKFLSIAKSAKKMGYSVLVSTNGTCIDESFAKKAAKLKLEVQVSIDGSNAETNDYYRGHGSFNMAHNGVKTLVRNGVYTILSYVYQTGNEDDLESYYKMAIEAGADEARFIPIKIFGRALTNGLDPVNIHELILKANQMFQKNPDFLKISKRDCFSILSSTCSCSIKKFSCGTGHKTLLIDSDCTLYPCTNMAFEEFKLGNLRDKDFDFKKLWFYSKMLEEYRCKTAIDNLNPQCSACFVRYWCLGFCRGETYSITGNISLPANSCADFQKAIIEMFWIVSVKEGTQKENFTMC